MSLLGREVSISKFTKPGLIILISVFLGCETADDFGVNYSTGNELGVKFIEIDLPSSNILIDSLRTDGERRILVGSYSDPRTGDIEAEGYFQYFFVGGTFPGDSLTFESVSAQFKIDSKIGSTSSENLIISQSFDTLKSNLIYLRTNKEVLASYSIAEDIVQIDDSTMNIELIDIYGRNLYQLIKNDATYFNTPDAGGDYAAPTLALQFENAQSIVSVDLESEDSWIKVFMKGAAIDTLYELEFGLLEIEYSNIERSKIGSEFEAIVENANFDIASGETFVDPLTGISTAFDMSSVADFFSSNKNIIINSASFSFDFSGEADRDTLASHMLYLRKDDLSFFGPAFKLNQFGNIIATDNSYLSPISNGRINFNPSISYLNEVRDELILDATNFTRNLYRSSSNSEEFTFQNPFIEEPRVVKDMVFISTENTSLKRIVFKKEGIKLRLYYTQLNE